MTDTVSIRLPEQVVSEAKTFGLLLGFKTPGAALDAAWRAYVRNHGEEIAQDYEREARRLRERPLPDGGNIYG